MDRRQFNKTLSRLGFAIAGAGVVPALAQAPPKPPIWEFPPGVTPPGSLSVTLSGAGPLSGGYSLAHAPPPNRGHIAAFGYSWISPLFMLIPTPYGVLHATQIRVSYSGAGFPRSMFVSVYASAGLLLAQFTGPAPLDTPSAWNETLPGMFAGSANVKA